MVEDSISQPPQVCAEDKGPRQTRHAGAVSPYGNADDLRPRSCHCEHDGKDIEDDYHPSMLP